MFYIRAFIKSLYNIAWLKNQKTDLKRATNYIILFVLALAIGYAGYFTYVIPRELSDIRDQIIQYVPDFHAELKDGELSVADLEQPYYFTTQTSEGNISFLIDTISTSTEMLGEVIDLEDKRESKIVITQTGVAFYDASLNNASVQDFADIPDTTITKAEIEKWTNDVLENRGAFFGILLVLWFILLAISRVAYLVALAFLVLTFNKLRKGKEQWTFGQIYSVGIYAVTLPSLVVVAVHFFGLYVPYLYTILMLIWLTVIVMYESQHSSEVSLEGKKK